MEMYCLNTPLGPLKISGDADGLEEVVFDSEASISKEKIPSCLVDAVQQIREYFEHSREHFQLKLKPRGTSFQQKVWRKLTDIDFGKTISYQKLANELGDPKVIRAAASANGRNPLAIVIPCHSVVGSDGSLTGYAGGLDRKKWLLEHESRIKQTTLF